MGRKLSNIYRLVNKTTMNMCEKTTQLNPTRQSPKQVLVGALRQTDASAITERAIPNFQERHWSFSKIRWERCINHVEGTLVRDGEGEGVLVVSVMLMLVKRQWIVEVFVDALVAMQVALQKPFCWCSYYCCIHCLKYIKRCRLRVRKLIVCSHFRVSVERQMRRRRVRDVWSCIISIVCAFEFWCLFP